MMIRRAAAADAGPLTRLMHRSRAYDGPYRAILQGYAVTAEQIGTDHVYVAESEDTLLGFYSLVLSGPEPELDLLFVDDAAQGRGIGASLFDHMIATARAHGCERVLVVSHPPAEAFYVRMGARRIGTKPPQGRVTWERPILARTVTGNP